MISIRLRLLKWLIVPILTINLAGATLTYLLAWMPAQLAFDQGLLDAAGALAARMRPAASGGEAAIDLPRQAEQVLLTDDDDAVYFAVLAGSRLLAGDADFPAAPSGQAQVAGQQQVYDDVMRGEPVRVAARYVRSGGQMVRIAVAKTVRKRQQIRAAIVRALVPLETVFTLGLVGLIWFSVTNGLRPLALMRSNLDGRESGDLAPLDPTGVPAELTSLVGALNGLLDKVRTGAKAQHDFLADVAHQLRTPLAGLKLQFEWLGERHRHDPDTVHSLRLMLLANERMIRQVNQLLALARAEPARFEKSRLEPLDLAPLVAQTIQYFVDEAGKKQIDIGFELAPARVEGDSFLLRDLIDNLVDNAVRYTPAGGTVTVRCVQDGKYGVFSVEDSGPGIAPHLRASVFQRFVRLDAESEGSGLGLAIVRDIVQAHGATIELGNGVDGTGMLITVRFGPPATS